MFKLEKCLFFMKLSTGGIIIGSIHLLVQTALFFYFAAYLTIYDCTHFEKSLQLVDNRICKFNRDFIAFNWLFLATSGGLAFFCYNNCIRGIREKKFELLAPFVYFLAVVALLSIYDIFYFTLQGIVMALIKGVIAGYMFLVVNSYYLWLRDVQAQTKPIPLDSE